MSTLSVIISTKNNAKIIERALQSVSFADEIVVIDIESEDKTVEIARQYTDKIYQHADQGYIEPVRNFSLEKASGDWVLVLDADEEVSSGLKKAIKGIIEAADQAELPDCYYLPRKNIIFQHWLQTSGWWPDYQLRFFRNGYVEWSERIHSVPITRGEVKEFPAQEKFALIHHNYQRVEQFIERLNRYTNIQAREQAVDEFSAEEVSQTIIKAFKDEFFRRFFLERGYQELPHGLAASLLQAFSEAVVPLKVWQKHNFQSVPETELSDEETKNEQSQAVWTELVKFKKELAYWLATVKVEEKRGLSKLYWRLRRRFCC